jgi:hypothetical protein
MSEDQMLAFLLCRPFEPFVLPLVGGRQITVRHPEWISPSRAGLGVWLLHETGHVEAIGIGLILSLRTLNPTDLSKLIG